MKKKLLTKALSLVFLSLGSGKLFAAPLPDAPCPINGGTIPNGSICSATGAADPQSGIFVNGSQNVTGSNITVSAPSDNGARSILVLGSAKLQLLGLTSTSKTNDAANVTVGDLNTTNTASLVLDQALIDNSGATSSIGILLNRLSSSNTGLTLTNSTVKALGSGNASTSAHGLKIYNGANVTISGSTIESTNTGNALFVQNTNSFRTDISLVNSTLSSSSSALLSSNTNTSSTRFRLSGTNTFIANTNGITARGNTLITDASNGRNIITVKGYGLYADSDTGTNNNARKAGEIHMHNAEITVAGSASEERVRYFDEESNRILELVTNYADSEYNGVYAANGGYIRLMNSTIQTSGDTTHGARATGSDSLLEFETSHIRTTGDRSNGLWIGTSNQLSSYKNGSITTEGANSHGVRSSGQLLIENTQVTTQGAGAYGIWAEESTGQITFNNGSIVTTGDNAHGVRIKNGGRVSIDPSSITVTGAGSAGVSVHNGGTLTVIDSSITSAQGDAIAADGGGTLTANLTGNSSLSGATNLIFATAGTVVHLTASDNTRLFGNIAGGTVTMNLQDQSRWTGASSDLSSLTLGGGALWNLNADSQVDTLIMNHGGVNFTLPTTGFKTLTLGALSGIGAFRMNTDLYTDEGGLLNVTGNATGRFGILVRNVGGYGVNSRELVQIADGDASFQLLNRDGMVDAAGYQYRLVRGNDPAILGDPNTWHLLKTNELSTEAKDGVNLAGSFPSAMLWFSQTASLSKRLGELRENPQAHEGGFWFRAYGGESRFEGAQGNRLTQKQGGFSAGVDHKLALPAGAVYVGLAAGVGEGSRRLIASGRSEAGTWHTTAYATWLYDTGFYLDTLLNYTRFENQIRSTLTDETISRADYRTSALGASVEAGWHLPFADGWFIEPQAQISALSLEGADFRFDNGLRIQNERSALYQGRLGARLGKEVSLSNGQKIRPYARLSELATFGSGGSVSVVDRKITPNPKSTRTELAFGITSSPVSDIHLYVDVARTFGNKLSEPWGVSAGFRKTW